eukprot:5294861-Lingulodinium_polyedra.AAC.1
MGRWPSIWSSFRPSASRPPRRRSGDRRPTRSSARRGCGHRPWRFCPGLGAEAAEPPRTHAGAT